MAEFTLQALHDEIEADPAGLGYKVGAVWKGDQEIADLINAQNYVVDVDVVEMEQARALTTYDAYNNLAIDEQEYLRWLTPNSGQLQITADVKLQLTGRSLTSNGVAGTGNDNSSWWAASNRTAMVAAFLAAIEVPGSRAEVLWGSGTVISAGNVGHAANL